MILNSGIHYVTYVKMFKKFIIDYFCLNIEIIDIFRTSPPLVLRIAPKSIASATTVRPSNDCRHRFKIRLIIVEKHTFIDSSVPIAVWWRTAKASLRPSYFYRNYQSVSARVVDRLLLLLLLRLSLFTLDCVATPPRKCCGDRSGWTRKISTKFSSHRGAFSASASNSITDPNKKERRGKALTVHQTPSKHRRRHSRRCRNDGPNGSGTFSHARVSHFLFIGWFRSRRGRAVRSWNLRKRRRLYSHTQKIGREKIFTIYDRRDVLWGIWQKFSWK